MLAFSAAPELVVMAQMMQAEQTERIGVKRANIPAGERAGNWHGTTEESVELGGRTITTQRPRGRTTDGVEIGLDTWKVFSSTCIESMISRHSRS